MYPSEMYFALFNFSNSSIMSLVRFRSASSCLNFSFRTSLVTVLLERMEPVVALRGVREEEFGVERRVEERAEWRVEERAEWRFERIVERRAELLAERRGSGLVGASAVKCQERESGA